MSAEKKKEVRRIFESIAFKYDFLNHLLSFGVDFYWRKKALRLTKIKDYALLLDVACGTGDVAIQANKYGVKNIIGADFSFNMLKLFNEKAAWSRGKVVQMAAENLPLKNESIDNITVSFGVRNFYDIQKGFDSFYSVLKNGGKATILEFKMPENFVFKNLYKFYFKNILPVVGGAVSGDKEAYTYLPRSVEEFDEKVNLISLLQNSGFSKIEKHSATFGIVQIIIAAK